MLEIVAGYLEAVDALISVAIPWGENWSTLVKKIFVKWQTYDAQHCTCVGQNHQIFEKNN